TGRLLRCYVRGHSLQQSFGTPTFVVATKGDTHRFRGEESHSLQHCRGSSGGTTTYRCHASFSPKRKLSRGHPIHLQVEGNIRGTLTQPTLLRATIPGSGGNADTGDYAKRTG